ncbi:major facilitator superfamily domain-containing protein [Catenaria anguillulae PL171]|uniref:Major facilitator superfamily domain-containing protein n=1 Tax=Catenaria anguillulae PL171 TaxID=765915 RepID=A0A1Y2I7L6_9FUNG|nr:major facilitator superfamily domain-containing protein [Catenaria anguillulae PL171]
MSANATHSPEPVPSPDIGPGAGAAASSSSSASPPTTRSTYPNANAADVALAPALPATQVPLLSTVSPSSSSRGPLRYAYLVFCALTGSVGFFMFGYYLGELNSISLLLPCALPTVSPDRNTPFLGLTLPECISMSKVQFSFANAIFALAGTVGAILAGPFTSRYGRIRTMQLLLIPFVLAPIALTLANSYAWLLVGRVLAGIGTGGSATVVPVYLSEISPPRLRGTVGNLSSAYIAVGLAIASLTGYYWSAEAPTWRWILALPLAVAVGQLVLLPVCAESPVWLKEHGKGVEARKVRRRLGHALVREGDDNDDEGAEGEVESTVRIGQPSSTSGSSSNHPEGDIEMEEGEAKSSSIRHNTDTTMTTTSPVPILSPAPTPVSVWTFLTDPQHRRSLAILVIAHASQQLSGINAYFVYSFFILTLIFSPADANLFYLILAFYNIPINYFPGLVIDKFGRRPLILFAMIGMSVSAMLFTVSVIIKVPVLTMITFVAAVTIFAVGLSNVPFILMAEVVEPVAVGAAATVSQVVNTLAQFVILFVFPILLDAIGSYTFLFFTVYLAVAAIALAVVLPETKGRSPQEVVGELRARQGMGWWPRSRGAAARVLQVSPDGNA